MSIIYGTTDKDEAKEMEQMYEDEGNNTFYPCSYFREEPDDYDC